MSLPSRGEVWLCDLGMIAKVRPVLVINVPFNEQDYALFHVIPHTAAIRNSQFEVAVPLRFLQPGAFNTQGSQSVPRATLIRCLGSLDDTQFALVEASFRRWLKL